MFNIKFLNKILDRWFFGYNHVELAKRSVSLGVMTSVFLVIIKFIAWRVTGSISLQASMTDSLLDALVSFLVYHALKYSDVKFDDNHNFGHEKVEGVVSIFQCLIIFYSGIMILHESYEAWNDPQPIQNTMVGIVIMLVSTVAVYQLIYFQKYVARKTSSVLVKGDSLHYLSDFCMNLAVIGSLLLSNFFAHVDIIFGSVVGIYVLYSALQVLRNALVDLMDEALPKNIRNKIVKEILAVSGVEEIKVLRTRSAGMKRHIEAIIGVDRDVSLKNADDITKNVEKNISKLFAKVDILVKAEPKGK
ncbi:MAG: cation diffusion facilitator family transporter [Alphaproteobacteria bacterium]|nr:cation diffusion facilitator family transporter [Alphaproteobacteria bacterium]